MAMQYLERQLRTTGSPADLARADIVSAMLKSRGRDIPLPSVLAPVETKPLSQEFRPLTDQEQERLIKDGAFILDLITGNTIEDQEGAGRLFRYIYREGGDRLLKLPSIITQVAIYPDPEKFFIPNSGSKNLPTQEELAKKDGQELRERLGLKDDSLDVIIPDQASTLTEVTFRYLDETTKKDKAVWLFGPNYGYLYGRTKNPVNDSGSLVANVGNARPGHGIGVSGWSAGGGHEGLHVVRLVVAKKK